MSKKRLVAVERIMKRMMRVDRCYIIAKEKHAIYITDGHVLYLLRKVDLGLYENLKCGKYECGTWQEDKVPDLEGVIASVGEKKNLQDITFVTTTYAKDACSLFMLLLEDRYESLVMKAGEDFLPVQRKFLEEIRRLYDVTFLGLQNYVTIRQDKNTTTAPLLIEEKEGMAGGLDFWGLVMPCKCLNRCSDRDLFSLLLGEKD